VFSYEQETALGVEFGFLNCPFSCDLDLILDSGIQENCLTDFFVRNKIMGPGGRQCTKQFKK